MDYAQLGDYIVFNLAALAIMACAVIFAIRRPSLAGAATTGIMAAMAFACLFIGNTDKIASFKASSTGIEATTREARSVIDKAQATVASLNELAKTIGKIEVNLIAATGSMSNDALNQQRLKADLLKTLKTLGMDDKSISEVSLADKNVVELDYSLWILQSIPMVGNRDAIAAYDKVVTEKGTTPDNCEALLKRFNVSDPKPWAILQDYRYYEEKGQQRRPDVWVTRFDH